MRLSAYFAVFSTLTVAGEAHKSNYLGKGARDTKEAGLTHQLMCPDRESNYGLLRTHLLELSKLDVTSTMSIRGNSVSGTQAFISVHLSLRLNQLSSAWKKLHPTFMGKLRVSVPLFQSLSAEAFLRVTLPITLCGTREENGLTPRYSRIIGQLFFIFS